MRYICYASIFLVMYIAQAKEITLENILPLKAGEKRVDLEIYAKKPDGSFDFKESRGFLTSPRNKTDTISFNWSSDFDSTDSIYLYLPDITLGRFSLPTEQLEKFPSGPKRDLLITDWQDTDYIKIDWGVEENSVPTYQKGRQHSLWDYYSQNLYIILCILALIIVVATVIVRRRAP